MFFEDIFGHPPLKKKSYSTRPIDSSVSSYGIEGLCLYEFALRLPHPHGFLQRKRIKHIGRERNDETTHN